MPFPCWIITYTQFHAYLLNTRFLYRHTYYTIPAVFSSNLLYIYTCVIFLDFFFCFSPFHLLFCFVLLYSSVRYGSTVTSVMRQWTSRDIWHRLTALISSFSPPLPVVMKTFPLDAPQIDTYEPARERLRGRASWATTNHEERTPWVMISPSFPWRILLVESHHTHSNKKKKV
jgi:hypothetical protein